MEIPKNLSKHLDDLVERYNTPGFIPKDPVQFPRRFQLLQDIEIVGVLVSMIAWGRREMILDHAEKILAEMDGRPYAYIRSGAFRRGRESLHRTCKWDDFADICAALQQVYREGDSLEQLFAGPGGGLDLGRYKGYFRSSQVSDWERGSASKRLHMFLRWMVRDDGIVDIGCWKRIRPAQLFVPLDTHVARNARELGLLTRRSNDRKAVEELTARLRLFCPADPVKYDFALFGATV